MNDASDGGDGDDDGRRFGLSVCSCITRLQALPYLLRVVNILYNIKRKR